MFQLISNKKAYSLVEVLVALMIISSILVVSTSSIFSSSRIAINNEIADRANTMAVRILELAKKPDKKIKSCDTGNDIDLQVNTNYSVGNVNLANASQSQSGNACIRLTFGNSTLITTCSPTSTYATTVTFPGGTNSRSQELYCIQMRIDSITGSTLSKVTVRIVYNDLSDTNLVRTFYGLI